MLIYHTKNKKLLYNFLNCTYTGLTMLHNSYSYALMLHVNVSQLLNNLFHLPSLGLKNLGMDIKTLNPHRLLIGWQTWKPSSLLLLKVHQFWFGWELKTNTGTGILCCILATAQQLLQLFLPLLRLNCQHWECLSVGPVMAAGPLPGDTQQWAHAPPFFPHSVLIPHNWRDQQNLTIAHNSRHLWFNKYSRQRRSTSCTCRKQAVS